MNQRILFTPVGGTDPISMNNCKDGSMLHICRVYQPDKIIMYMSKEVLENQEKDNRYSYALERLFQLQKRKPAQIQEIRRPKLNNVQDFNYFYTDFREIIRKIFEEMDATDQLFLNVSSGTPAMKSGLLVLQTLGEFPARMIQVLTPEYKMNEHTHRNYDIETLWELDEDNAPDFENRCREITCPALSKIKKEEIIKKHVEAYDYQAAVAVAKTMASEDTSRYIGLLEMGASRVLLDFPAVDQWQKSTGMNLIPVKSGNSRKYFEYALNLQLKLERKEYVDFIRGITPIIVDLFEIVLKKQCGIKLNDYTKIVKQGRQWDERKLAGTDIKKILAKNYGDFRGGYIYSDHLKTLILAYSDDLRLKQLAEDLRKVESSIRNMAAHQIVSITEEKIKKETGFTGRQIMNKIKEFFSYTGLGIKSTFWDSYDEMNQRIFEKIN